MKRGGRGSERKRRVGRDFDGGSLIRQSYWESKQKNEKSGYIKINEEYKQLWLM